MRTRKVKFRCKECGIGFTSKLGFTKHKDKVARYGHPRLANPKPVAKGKFIPCKAVKFNKDGSVTLKK